MSYFNEDGSVVCCYKRLQRPTSLINCVDLVEIM